MYANVSRESIERQVSFISKLRSKFELCREEKLDILKVYFGLHREALNSGSNANA